MRNEGVLQSPKEIVAYSISLGDGRSAQKPSVGPQKTFGFKTLRF
jgi:hypothetical protein